MSGLMPRLNTQSNTQIKPIEVELLNYPAIRLLTQLGDILRTHKASPALRHPLRQTKYCLLNSVLNSLCSTQCVYLQRDSQTLKSLQIGNTNLAFYQSIKLLNFVQTCSFVKFLLLRLKRLSFVHSD